NDRMEKVFEDYKAKGINVVGINSNSTEPATEVKSHAAEKGLKFTILKDDGTRLPIDSARPGLRKSICSTRKANWLITAASTTGRSLKASLQTICATRSMK